MRIDTRLKIISTVTMVAIAILAVFLIGVFIEFNSAKNDYALGDEIETNFFERASFRDKYFLYQEGYVRTQWDANKEMADNLLHQAEVQFHGEENMQALQRLRMSIEESAVIFHRIANATEVLKSADGNRHVYEELIKRLSSQLLLKDGVIRDTATALQNESTRRGRIFFFRLVVLQNGSGGSDSL